MRGLSVEEILKATKGKLLCGNAFLKEQICGVSTDTRTLKKGEIFVALKGDKFDGHGYIREAIRKGACGAIVEVTSDINKKFILIQVKDTTKAYGEIAHYYREKFDIPFIGITGSNGKTTTKEMIAGVLGSRLNVLKNEGTENNLIGLSKTLLSLNRAHEAAVLELGTNHFGEIKELGRILVPDMAVITNIGPSHLEFLKSPSGVYKEKAELINTMATDGTALLNADDTFLPKIKKPKNGQRVITFGINKKCDFRAAKICRENDGVRFRVNDKHSFKIRLLGRHNVYNALAAIAVGFLYKIDYDDIYESLLAFEPQKGRLCLKTVGGIDIIDDTYNSNPQSLRAAVEVLADIRTTGRKILVCGDMLELGAAAEEFHKEIGAIASSADIDFLIGVGDFSNTVKDAAVCHGMRKDRVFACGDNRQAAGILEEILQEKDVVLLKGSRRLKLEEVLNAISSFISTKGALVRV